MQEHLNKKLMKSKTNLVYIFIAMIISNFQASLWYSLAGFSPSASSFSLLTDFSPLSLATSLVELSVSASFSSISVYIWIYPHTHSQYPLEGTQVCNFKRSLLEPNLKPFKGTPEETHTHWIFDTSCSDALHKLITFLSLHFIIKLSDLLYTFCMLVNHFLNDKLKY